MHVFVAMDSGSKQAKPHTNMIDSDVPRSTTISIDGPTPTESNITIDLLTQIEQRRIWFDRVYVRIARLISLPLSGTSVHIG
jgi:hypothetical protein